MYHGINDIRMKGVQTHITLRDCSLKILFQLLYNRQGKENKNLIEMIQNIKKRRENPYKQNELK